MASEAVNAQGKSSTAGYPLSEPTQSEGEVHAAKTGSSALFLDPLLRPLCGFGPGHVFFPKALNACRNLGEYTVRKKHAADIQSATGQTVDTEYQHKDEVAVPTEGTHPLLYVCGGLDGVATADPPQRYSIRTKNILRLLLRNMKDFRFSEIDKVFSIFLNTEDVQEVVIYFHGDPSTSYQGGGYFGKLIFPADYPFYHPRFFFLTPNGRYLDYTNGDTQVKKSGVCVDFAHLEAWKPGLGLGGVLEQIHSRFYDAWGQWEVGQYQPPHLKQEWAGWTEGARGAKGAEEARRVQVLEEARKQFAKRSHAVNRKLLENPDMRFVREGVLDYLGDYPEGELGREEHFARCCHLRAVMDGTIGLGVENLEEMSGLVCAVKTCELKELEAQAQLLEQQLQGVSGNTENDIKTKLNAVYCSLALLYSEGCFDNEDPPQTIVPADIAKSLEYQFMASQLEANDGGHSDYVFAKTLTSIQEKATALDQKQIEALEAKRLWYLFRAAEKLHPGGIFMLKQLKKDLPTGVSASFAGGIPNTEDYYAGKFSFKKYKKALKEGGRQQDILAAKKEARIRLENYIKQSSTHASDPLDQPNYRVKRAQEYLLEMSADDALADAAGGGTGNTQAMKDMALRLKEFLLDNPFSGKTALILSKVLTALQQATQVTAAAETYKKVANHALAVARANGQQHS